MGGRDPSEGVIPLKRLNETHFRFECEVGDILRLDALSQETELDKETDLVLTYEYLGHINDRLVSVDTWHGMTVKHHDRSIGLRLCDTGEFMCRVVEVNRHGTCTYQTYIVAWIGRAPYERPGA